MKHFSRQKNSSKQTGFTIIETLVAITILLVATTGPLTFAQSGLRASFLARDQIGAFYLAQDVIETIKNIRDNRGLAGTGGWLNGLVACKPTAVNSTVVCNMDTAQSDNIHTRSCSDTGCDTPLFYDSTEKQYVLYENNQADRTESKYTRTIYITELVAGQEAQIVVEVKWDSNSFSDKSVVVQENIYNWVPRYLP
jgi:prepilin-type N-terminal cleavage/methylation domain-containing protein